jgi:hypothetical protein
MGYVYDRASDDYVWVDEGDEPQSPIAANPGILAAVNQYYGDGSGPPNVDIPGHDPVNWFDPSTQTWLTNTPGGPIAGNTPPPAPAPTATGGGGGWSTPAFTGPWAPDLSYWEDAPSFDFQFDAPPTITPYQSPTGADAQAEPGYDFARSEGLRALTQSRAAQGLARTGGTLKDLITWGNKFADQNYSNVDARQRANYTLNTGNLMDLYKTNEANKFAAAQAEFAPKLTSWGSKMSAFGTAATDAFNRAWDSYKFASDDAFRHWQTIYTGGQDAPPPA